MSILQPSYSPVRSVYALHLDKIPKHKSGWVVTTFESLHLAKEAQNYNQIFSLYTAANAPTTDKQYSLSFTDLGNLFGLSRHNARQRYSLGVKSNKNNPISKVGRPSEIRSSQLVIIKQHIKNLELKNQAPEPLQLLTWINKRFQKILSPNWLYHYIANKKNGLFEVVASPLEDARINVTVEQLVEYSDRAADFLTKIDFDFLMNCDESGVSGKISAKKKQVISLKPETTTYRVFKGAGHITVLPTIFATGEHLRTMMIMQKKTCEPELFRWGLPDSTYTLCVSTSSGYITQDLFLLYIKKILIPEVNIRRLVLKKPWATAGLVLDGAKQHEMPEIQMLLALNNILLLWLVPHSSHLTQPCDRLLFSLFKTYLGRISAKHSNISKTNQRILKILNALDMASTPQNNISSFANAGFMMSKASGSTIINFDRTKILGNSRAPTNPIKTSEFLKSLKRKNLPRGYTKKEMAKQRRLMIKFSES